MLLAERALDPALVLTETIDEAELDKIRPACLEGIDRSALVILTGDPVNDETLLIIVLLHDTLPCVLQ